MWTEDLERLAAFYSMYFGASVGERYANPAKSFASRFIAFADGARRTGDGYYESVVLDPDGNRIELAATRETNHG